MFLFQKKIGISESGLLKGWTDWHCHILPGVDDGFKTMEDSLSVLKLYEEAGISTVWLTPHIMEDIPNTVSSLKERFEELKAAYKGPLNLHLASENMLDNLFSERLSAGELLPYDGDRLLVETSYFNPPMDMDELLGRVKARGLYPVLAHPERYIYMNFKQYDKLRSMGVLFQLNMSSLYGSYGPQAQAKALKLLKEDYYTLAGTDLHREASFRNLMEQKLPEKVIFQMRRSCL